MLVCCPKNKTLLHKLDGLTPVIPLLLLPPPQWDENQVHRSVIHLQRSQSLMCKVTVLIYLAGLDSE